MKSLFLLIPVSVVFFALAVVFFMWAVNNGQYDDLDGEGERILFDDDETDPDSPDASISSEQNDNPTKEGKS